MKAQAMKRYTSVSFTILFDNGPLKSSDVTTKTDDIGFIPVCFVTNLTKFVTVEDVSLNLTTGRPK